MEREQEKRLDPVELLRQIRGTYGNRAPEYHLAVDVAFFKGILACDSPVLDVGCGDPFNGLLRFLQEFGWGIRQPSKGADYVKIAKLYVGIDREFDSSPHRDREIMRLAEEETNVSALLRRDLENKRYLPFPPTNDRPVKTFACAFCIEVLEHLETEYGDHLVSEMQRVAGTVFVVGPNRDFGHFYHYAPGHKRLLGRDDFERWGFQHIGYRNFNGRVKESGEFFPHDNGQPETSSEIWGLYLDPIACTMRPPKSQRDIREFYTTPEGTVEMRRQIETIDPGPRGLPFPGKEPISNKPVYRILPGEDADA